MSYLLALAAVFILAVPIAEIAARRWIRAGNKYYVWPPHYRQESTLDPRVFPNFPSPARFIVNREGERGYELPRTAKKLYRVLVAGGSAPECLVLDQDVTWPLLLQRTLERQENLIKLEASHVYVGNIGRSGIGAEGLQFVLSKILPRMPQLDLIIIMVGATDVINWLQAGAPPVAVQKITSSTNMLNYFGWHPDGPFSWNPRRTALAEIVRRLRQIFLQPVRRRTDVGRGLLRARMQQVNAVEVRQEVQNPHVVVDNFECHFRKALKAAREKAHRVIVAIQPWLQKTEARAGLAENLWQGAVGDVYHEEVKIFYSTEVMSQLMAHLSERAIRVAQQVGVEWYNIGAAIDPSINPFYDLFHFTPSGSAAVAGILTDAILHKKARTVATVSRCFQSSQSDGPRERIAN